MPKWEIFRIAAHTVVMFVAILKMEKAETRKDLHSLIYCGFLFLAVVISFVNT